MKKNKIQTKKRWWIGRLVDRLVGTSGKIGFPKSVRFFSINSTSNIETHRYKHHWYKSITRVLRGSMRGWNII